MMSVLEQLAPRPVDPDPAWVAETLRRITSTAPGRRRRRGRKFIVAGSVAGAVLGMGVAVAQTGVIPDGAMKRIAGITSSQGLELTTTPVLIADLHLSDGTRWQVWRALNDSGGTCTSTGDPSKEAGGPEDWIASCSWQPGAIPGKDYGMQGDLAMFGFYGNDERAGLPIAYGQILDPEITSVRIVGPGFRKTLKPSPETGGFGVELPRSTIDQVPGSLFGGMEFQFLDSHGHVVHTSSP